MNDRVNCGFYTLKHIACVIATFDPELNFKCNLSLLKEKLSETTIEDNLFNIQVVNNMREWSYNVFSQVDISKVTESYYQQKLLKIKVDDEIEARKKIDCNNHSGGCKKGEKIQGHENDSDKKEKDEVIQPFRTIVVFDFNHDFSKHKEYTATVSLNDNEWIPAESLKFIIPYGCNGVRCIRDLALYNKKQYSSEEITMKENVRDNVNEILYQMGLRLTTDLYSIKSNMWSCIRDNFKTKIVECTSGNNFITDECISFWIEM